MVRLPRQSGILALIIALSLGSGLRALAQCDLKVTSAYTSDTNGNPYKPQVGDTYRVTFHWTVTGTPRSSYDITFTEANQKYVWTGLPASPGTYWGYVGWQLPLDSAIPFTITLDSGHVTGNTDTKGAVYKGSFTPVPPKTAIEYYAPQQHTGSETFSVTWNDGSGTITNGFTLMGVPTTDSFQQVVSSSGPTGATQVTTQPTGDPVWQTSFTNFTPVAGHDAWNCTQNFVVTDSNMRANPALLRKATWAQLAALPADKQVWLQPDQLVQSNDASVIAFVNKVLPANYKTKMTPYDAARALFLAVVKNTTYKEPPDTDGSALSTLQTRVADCLGFSTLHAACLRYIGIPSRTCCGWWTGTNQWHCTNEFYLPGCGWVGADGSQDKVWWDPTGKYSYMFGSDTYRNGFCEVSRGTDHHTANFAVTELQVGWFYYWGNATYSGYSDTCSLQ
jgi:transglutaminase-like putative cysteine protease